MGDQRLVTVVGATGAQGNAVVRSLIEANKYKVTIENFRNICRT